MTDDTQTDATTAPAAIPNDLEPRLVACADPIEPEADAAAIAKASHKIVLARALLLLLIEFRSLALKVDGLSEQDAAAIEEGLKASREGRVSAYDPSADVRVDAEDLLAELEALGPEATDHAVAARDQMRRVVEILRDRETHVRA